MGLFNVPQFIDIEDTIVGPLTAKQLGWIAAGFVVLLVLFSLLDMSAFIIAAIVVGFIFGMLAFYRPHSQPLILFVFSMFAFFFKPKMYVWHRMPEAQEKKKVAIKAEPHIIKKKLSANKIAELSKMLDIKKL